jgi:adenine-specific DNA-methyltransferase
MATGISKTKWNGDLQISNSNAGAHTYHPIWNSGANSNRLYFGDNLPVLRELLKDHDVRGNVRLVYIDPPYATNSVFQTRQMQDAYTDLLVGADYISFMRERFLLLKELLAENGSIYVHLDNKMVFNVKVLMDEIFGSENFRAMITRKKCKSKNYTKNTFGNVSDYILFYAKSENPIWNRQYEEWGKEKIFKEYPFIEQETGRRYKRVPIHAPGVRNGASGKSWRDMMPPEGKHWQYTPDKLEEMDKRGEIYWSKNGNPRKKVYLDESEGIPIQDIWLDFVDSNNQNTLTTGYPTEKNIDLLKRIILSSSNEGDLVLDCFAGSGTTLVAASELNRRWIGVDIGSEAIKVILNRLQNGSQTLDNYIKTNKQNEENELPLFTDFIAKGDIEKAINPISDYAIYANSNYSGVEFPLPLLAR